MLCPGFPRPGFFTDENILNEGTLRPGSRSIIRGQPLVRAEPAYRVRAKAATARTARTKTTRTASRRLPFAGPGPLLRPCFRPIASAMRRLYGAPYAGARVFPTCTLRVHYWLSRAGTKAACGYPQTSNEWFPSATGVRMIHPCTSGSGTYRW